MRGAISTLSDIQFLFSFCIASSLSDSPFCRLLKKLMPRRHRSNNWYTPSQISNQCRRSRNGNRRSRRSRNRSRDCSWHSANETSWRSTRNISSSALPNNRPINPPPIIDNNSIISNFSQPVNKSSSKTESYTNIALSPMNSILNSVLSRVTELLNPKERKEKVAPVVESTRGPNALMITKPDEVKLVFQCQLAHGSPTALISDFNNPAELYQKIANSYDGVTVDQILYCTRNTHRVDVESILSGSLMTTDFLFAHIRGQKKEVELTKEAPMLGVTLSDNWAGRVYIRKIDDSMQLGKMRSVIELGDHIEAINGQSLVGKRHFMVANMLRQIPVGEKFTIRLISPLKSGFSFIAPRSGGMGGSRKFNSPLAAAGATDGGQTIRFKSDGKAVIEEPSNKVVIDRLNNIFDNYLGFNDDELANTVVDIGRECKTVQEMMEGFRHSSLSDFDFTPPFIFDLWDVIEDWKKGRLGANPPPLKHHSQSAKSKVDDKNVVDFLSWPKATEKNEETEEKKYNEPKELCYDNVETKADSENEEDDFEDDDASSAPLPPPPSLAFQRVSSMATSSSTMVAQWLIDNEKKNKTDNGGHINIDVE